MKNLVIIAAGGCGREVLQWAKDINKKENRWNIKGFLDDNLQALEGLKCDVPILATIDEYEIQPDDEFICCIGNSNVRKMVVEKLKAKGAVFVTLVHPNAVIADSSTLGEGVIIYPYDLISDNAVIGDQCIINMYSSVAHDSVLGEYCTISAHCDITGMCKLGPRPLLVRYLDRYNEEQIHRNDVKPGLTGLAQANGRNELSWDDKFKLDNEYVKNITFLGDLQILAETVKSVLNHEGISSETSATMEEFMGSN